MIYKAIGFDYGGVIEGRPGPEFNAMVCSTIAVSKAEYETTCFAHNRDTMDGKPISENELWSRVLSDLNKQTLHTVLTESITEYKRTNKVVNTALLDLIDTLRKTGLKVGLLSNNSVSVASRLRDDGIDSHFDSFIVSAEVGMAKPDPKLFQLFAADLDVSMNELIFVDDSKQSLSTSGQCGFTPLLYTSFTDLKEQLTRLGIDV